MRRFALLVVIALVACNKPAPAPQAKAEPAKSAPEPAPKALAPPDACALVTLASVANVTGWKAPKSEHLPGDASYLSICHIVDAPAGKRSLTIAVSVGSAPPGTSDEYAQLVGDRMGTLRSPAKPVSNFGVPAIEMDGGPAAQMIQARLPESVELTITSDSLGLARTLFPQALLNLRAKLPADGPRT